MSEIPWQSGHALPGFQQPVCARLGSRRSFDHFVGAPRNVAGISNLSALAVFTLIANSDFVGSWTGKSAELLPHLPLPSVDKIAVFW